MAGNSKSITDQLGVPYAFEQVADIGWIMLEKGNKIDITYPTTTTELFTYIVQATTIATVLVTYTDTTKEDISSVERLT